MKITSGRWPLVAVLAAAAFAQELQHVVVVVNIEVPVRVFSGGRFVADLSIDEFEVFENGQPQTIEAVYLVKKTRVEREEGPGLQGLSPQVESRYFVLYFEMDSYLPELEEVGVKRGGCEVTHRAGYSSR